MHTPSRPDDKPNCATPDALPYVDATFENARGQAAVEFRDRFCTGCPCGTTCLSYAMTHDEHGVWGGANKHQRTKIRSRTTAA